MYGGDEDSVRDKLANLSNMTGRHRSWRFIGLIVTRTKRRRYALENFCSVKIFSPRKTGTKLKREQSSRKEKNGRERKEEEEEEADRDVDVLRSRPSKSQRMREFTKR